LTDETIEIRADAGNLKLWRFTAPSGSCAGCGRDLATVGHALHVDVVTDGERAASVLFCGNCVAAAFAVRAAAGAELAGESVVVDGATP
jgi:hypothetical protein